MLFDQCDPRFDRRTDIGADQARRAAANHYHIRIELFGAPYRWHLLAPVQPLHGLFRRQGKDAQQREREQQVGTQDAAQGFDLRQLGTGIHIDQGPRQHTQLTDQEITQSGNRGQPHHQIDDKEGKNRHQAQGEEIQGPFPFDTAVHGRQLLAETALHPVPQQQPRYQKGNGRAEGAGKGDQDRPPQQSENRSAGQGHHRRPRQRQSRHQHIDDEIA